MLKPGDFVTDARHGTGVVEKVWVAQWFFQRQPPGTQFARVRFPGKWRRMNGAPWESVITKRADRFLPIPIS